MTDWTDVVARARGLAGRLLGRDRLVEAAHARDLSALADLLVRSGYVEIAETAHHDPVDLERHARRAMAARLELLAHWSADRFPLLGALYEDEDCNSLRSLVRGLLAGAPAEQRLAGLVPTPALSLPALAELARQPGVAQVAALLVAWGHPYGSALLAEASRQQPDAFRLQLAVDRRYAERALRAADAAGEPMLRYVRLRLDVENAWTAIALAARTVIGEAAELFIAGGDALPLDVYRECAGAADEPGARALLVRRTAGTIVARVVAPEVRAWTQDDALLRAQLVAGRAEWRLAPLGIGTIVQYVLRGRAELRDLARIAWGMVLNVPRGAIVDALVTP